MHFGRSIKNTIFENRNDFISPKSIKNDFDFVLLMFLVELITFIMIYTSCNKVFRKDYFTAKRLFCI